MSRRREHRRYEDEDEDDHSHRGRHKRHSWDDDDLDNLDDMAHELSYVKRRLSTCADLDTIARLEADQLDLEERTKSMLATLIDNAARERSRIQALSKTANIQASNLLADQNRLAETNRKLADTLDACIVAQRALAADMMGIRDQLGALTEVVVGLQQRQSHSQTQLTGKELKWREVIKRAYSLPEDVDWNRIRLKTDHAPLLYSRLKRRKYYLDRSKLDFSHRDGMRIRPEFILEFVEAVYNDCPVVTIEPPGRAYYCKQSIQ